MGFGFTHNVCERNVCHLVWRHESPDQAVCRRSNGVQQNRPPLVLGVDVVGREVVFETFDILAPVVLTRVERCDEPVEACGMPEERLSPSHLDPAKSAWYVRPCRQFVV